MRKKDKIYHKEELFRMILGRENFGVKKENNLFSQTIKNIERFKKTLAKELELQDFYDFGELQVDYNFLLSTINSKNEWRREEIDLLLKQVERATKYQIIKQLAKML